MAQGEILGDGVIGVGLSNRAGEVVGETVGEGESVGAGDIGETVGDGEIKGTFPKTLFASWSSLARISTLAMPVTGNLNCF